MNLTVPNGIQKGNPITAAFLSDLCRAVKAITPQSSSDILVSTTSGGTTFRQTNRPGGNSQSQSILYGTAAADWTSGNTISLTPCDCNGVATGEAAVTVTIPTSWGTVDLASATIGGAAASVTCKIISGTLLAFAFAGATPYLLGVKPTQIVSDPRYDASSHKYQVKVAWIFGTNSSTVSEWMDLLALSNQAIGHEVRYDTSTTAFQYRVVSAYLPEAPTQGAWTDLADIEESDTTPCI
jgi:hypothetical protein